MSRRIAKIRFKRGQIVKKIDKELLVGRWRKLCWSEKGLILDSLGLQLSMIVSYLKPAGPDTFLGTSYNLKTATIYFGSFNGYIDAFTNEVVVFDIVIYLGNNIDRKDEKLIIDSVKERLLKENDNLLSKNPPNIIVKYETKSP